MSYEDRRVELTGPHDSADGSCMLCRVKLDANGQPARVQRRPYYLSLIVGNSRIEWRLCREHIKEVRTALRGTIT